MKRTIKVNEIKSDVIGKTFKNKYTGDIAKPLFTSPYLGSLGITYSTEYGLTTMLEVTFKNCFVEVAE